MKTRTARLIRCGILAARDPDRRPYIHLAPRLVRAAARHELLNIEWREEWEALVTKQQAYAKRANAHTAVLRHIDHMVRRQVTTDNIPATFKAAPKENA